MDAGKGVEARLEERHFVDVGGWVVWGLGVGGYSTVGRKGASSEQGAKIKGSTGTR